MRAILSLSTLVLAANLAAQTDIVLPTAMTGVMASTANRIPITRHDSKAQQVFLGSEIGGSMQITRLCVRDDEQFAQAAAQVQNLEIRMGPTSLDHTNLGTNFAGNYSSAPTTVFGPANVNIPASNGNGTPTSFNLCIDFTTPYDHVSGNNLIVEIINRGTTSLGRFDDYCLNDPGCTTARVFALDPNATDGTVTLAQGLVMKLTGTPTGVGCPVELETLFAANNGGAVGGAVYFDLTVTNPTTITGFCTNTSVTAGLPIGMTVYTNTLVATWMGNHTAAGWTQVAIDDGNSVSAGNQNPSNCTLLAPLVLAPGVYPMALVGTNGIDSFNHRYTNGNGANQNYNDANLAIALGGGGNVPFMGSVFSPRIWNGSIKYISLDALSADFSGTFTNCDPAPLMASFTDLSCTTDGGGITSWLWDFGDGTTSSMQNPAHTYTMPGSYTVTLTVTDASHPDSTKVRTNYVVVGFGNDECVDAIQVVCGLNGPFNNLCGTDSTPLMTCGGSSDADVWFKYDHLGCDGMIDANLCTGTTYDSKIEVLSGDCGNLTVIACNDDNCGLQSRVTWAATQGASYYIRVGGFNASQGEFQLEVNVPGSATLIQAGCAGLSMTVTSDSASGEPEIGSTTTFLINGFGLPMIWFDFTIPTPGFPMTLCSPAGGDCVIACDFDYSVPITNPLNLPIPNDPVLCGGCFCVQGATVISLDGCDVGGIPYALADAYEIVIGSGT